MSSQRSPRAIECRNLSVSYWTVVPGSRSERRKLSALRQRKEIRALEDVSFDIERGQIVAVLGGNGAGKSTLLKTMVGAMRPRSGHVDLRGKPYLLAPGVGFNRRLSGRENVVLGGLAAGMTLDEVRLKEQGIIEFADIGRFIDLPVTTYSTGMYSRLAFSIASHVDPEILLIDEALSAGDGAFRSRATDKIRELCASNRTIMIVSHSAALVRELSTHAIWLHRGSLRRFGQIDDVYDEFEAALREGARSQLDQ